MDRALDVIVEVMSNKTVRAETRIHAVEPLLVAINRAAGKNPGVTINQGLQILPGPPPEGR